MLIKTVLAKPALKKFVKEEIIKITLDYQDYFNQVFKSMKNDLP